MINSVRGEVLEIGLDHVVIDVGGLGYAIQATPNTLATLRRGEQAELATTLVVREDSLTLYGFADHEERDLFLLLQTVSGIGPRIALATIAVLDPDSLRRALSEGDIAALTRVPGIGRKGAERLDIYRRRELLASAEPLTEDPETGQPVERVLHAPAVHFKGSGFYITDYRSNNYKEAARKDSTSPSSSSSSAKSESKAASSSGPSTSTAS